MADDSASSPARHARGGSRLRRALAAVVTVAVLVAALATWATMRLEGNIQAEEVASGLGTDRPVAPSASEGRRPLNVLMLGTDTRSGANGFVGGSDDGIGRSDTTILLHLSADRQRAIGVSIPRDSMVQMPDCRTPDGGRREGGLRMFNEAYTIGGSACVQRTVEQLTGVLIDHHVVVDFAGFRRMVDALGGVTVCVPRDVNDTTGNITLKAGKHVFKGDQALDYVRVRHGIDQTGDIGRMQRQQAFLSSMIQKATATGTLTNVPKLYKFLDAATKSVMTDPELANLNALRKLAQEVQGIGLDKIRFLTVPFQTYQPDPNRLMWHPEKAPRLWRLVREDRPLPARGKGVPAEPVKADPRDIDVEVLNGFGKPGAARLAATDLASLGFRVADTRRADADVSQTVVRYDPRFDRSARTVATAVRGAQLEPVDGLGRTVQVVLGPDYSGVDEIVFRRPAGGPSGEASPGSDSPTTDPDEAFQARSADDDVCG